jgi:hypothetical protein
VNGLQFEIVQMMTYDLWNLKFSYRNQFNWFLSLELIRVPSILWFLKIHLFKWLIIKKF